jgi:hypothetical protein
MSKHEVDIFMDQLNDYVVSLTQDDPQAWSLAQNALVVRQPGNDNPVAFTVTFRFVKNTFKPSQPSTVS